MISEVMIYDRTCFMWILHRLGLDRHRREHFSHLDPDDRYDPCFGDFLPPTVPFKRGAPDWTSLRARRGRDTFCGQRKRTSAVRERVRARARGGSGPRCESERSLLRFSADFTASWKPRLERRSHLQRSCDR